MNINTFIFDLGGVLLDLEEDASFRQLASLSTLEYETAYQKLRNADFFEVYEMGKISAETFRNEIRDLLQTQANNAAIDNAWNAMLLTIDPKRLELLQQLRKDHTVLILSNTNGIHVTGFNKILLDVSGKGGLEHFADRVFFSHDMGMRKPNTDIYEEVLRVTETNASRSLFLDDKLENLKGAEAVGINTMLVPTPNDIFKVLEHA